MAAAANVGASGGGVVYAAHTAASGAEDVVIVEVSDRPQADPETYRARYPTCLVVGVAYESRAVAERAGDYLDSRRAEEAQAVVAHPAVLQEEYGGCGDEEDGQNEAVFLLYSPPAGMAIDSHEQRTALTMRSTPW